MSVRTYDPSQVIVTINGVPMSGFTDGQFVEVIRNEPTWQLVVGADGFATRGKSNNYSGQLTLTLKQSSPSNDVLSALMAIDELTNEGVVPVFIKDLSGNSTYFSAQGWVQQYPSSTFDKTITDRSWVIQLATLDLFVGSNAES